MSAQSIDPTTAKGSRRQTVVMASFRARYRASDNTRDSHGSSGPAARRRAATRRAFGSVVTPIALGGAAGCGLVSQAAEQATTTVPAGFGWVVPAGVPSPVEMLNRAGIRLPAAADFTQTATEALDERNLTYLFVFRVDPQTAYALCDQAGLGGARSPKGIPAPAKARIGEAPVTDGSRWCEGAAPNDPSVFRYVLIEPGTPATVHLSIQLRFD